MATMRRSTAAAAIVAAVARSAEPRAAAACSSPLLHRAFSTTNPAAVWANSNRAASSNARGNGPLWRGLVAASGSAASAPPFYAASHALPATSIAAAAFGSSSGAWSEDTKSSAFDPIGQLRRAAAKAAAKQLRREVWQQEQEWQRQQGWDALDNSSSGSGSGSSSSGGIAGATLWRAEGGERLRKPRARKPRAPRKEVKPEAHEFFGADMAVDTSFQRKDLSRVEELFKMGAGIGSVEVNSWMFPYIVGYRDRVAFFNVEETMVAVQKALVFVDLLNRKGGHILLVNTDPTYVGLVAKTAKLSGHSYVNEHWIGGLMTNWGQLKYSVHAYKKCVEYFSTMLEARTSSFPKYVKATKRFAGIQEMTKLPDAIILFQATTKYKHILHEAQRMNIPVITFMDTYSPRVFVDYPIPVNVSSKAFFHFFCRLFVKVCAKAPQKPRIARAPPRSLESLRAAREGPLAMTGEGV